jgi:hypothetical protein
LIAAKEYIGEGAGMRQLQITTLTVFVFLFIWSSAVFANEPSDLTEQFMKQVVAGKVSAAIERYFTTNPIVMQKKQQIIYLKSQIEAVFKMHGKAFGYELVSQETLSPSLRRFVYISKHEFRATTWEFFVYKPKDVWIAGNVNFNDDYSRARSQK